jgi:hypothetical protein
MVLLQLPLTTAWSRVRGRLLSAAAAVAALWFELFITVLLKRPLALLCPTITAMLPYCNQRLTLLLKAQSHVSNANSQRIENIDCLQR